LSAALAPDRKPGPRFLVVEGNNGVGKSTVAAYLRDRLGAMLFHYPAEFVRFRERAGLDAGVAPVPRLLYYLAATVHLSELVRESLARQPVVCDRYLAGPLSLLLAEDAIAERELDRLAAPCEPYLCRPDLTLLVTADYEAARQRIRARTSGPDLTRVEQHVLASREFYARRETELRRHAVRLGPVAELDTSALSRQDMCRAAWSLVEARPRVLEESG
jgi:thymidylate kinase